jgi:hypothetical protein
LFSVESLKESVLKGATGNPFSVKRLISESSPFQPYLTATGLLTFSHVTTILFFLISAFAG